MGESIKKLINGIPLKVKERTGADRSRTIVSNGLPLPMGVVFSDRELSLKDVSDNPVKAGFYPLQKWQDGSWRFVAASFLADLKANKESYFSLVLDDDKTPAGTLDVKEDGRTYTVITGPLKFVVKKQSFNIIDQAWLDLSDNRQFIEENKIIDTHDKGIMAVVDGKTYTSSMGIVNSTEIERQDAGSVVLKTTGILSSGDDEKLDYKVWIKAFAGSQEVEVCLNIAKKSGETWDDYFCVDQISIDLPIKKAGEISYAFGGKESTHEGVVKQESYIYQKGSDAYDVGNDGKVTTSAKSGRSDDNINLGWADVRSGSNGLGVSYRWFWQNFPSSFAVYGDGTVSTQVWAKYHEPLKLYTGVSKTTDIRFYFHDGSEPVNQVGDRLKAFQLLTVAQAPSSWYCQDTRAMDSRLIDLDISNYPEEEHELLKQHMYIFEDGYKKLIDTRINYYHYAEGEDGYGFMNFGDAPAPSHTGKQPISREVTWWNNNYYDHPHIFFHQYMRTGELKYLDYALQHEYHLMDIDMASYDPVFKVPGDYRSGPSVMHIKNYAAEYINEKGQKDWHFGGQGGHWHFQSTEGLFDSYYLLATTQTVEKGLEAANFAVEIGTLSLSTQTRTIGHTFEALAAAYRHTWDEKYLVRMNQVWERVKGFVSDKTAGGSKEEDYRPEYFPYIHVLSDAWQNGIAISGFYKYRAFSPYVMGDMGIDTIACNTLDYSLWGREGHGWLTGKQDWSTPPNIMAVAGAWLHPLFPEKGFLPVLKQGLYNNLHSPYYLEHLKSFGHSFKYQWMLQYELAKEELKNSLFVSFTGFPRKVAAGETVTFNNQSIGGASCSWNFGDGSTSDSAYINVPHVYSQPGNYDVELVMTRFDGTTEKLFIKDYITVEG